AKYDSLAHSHRCTIIILPKRNTMKGRVDIRLNGVPRTPARVFVSQNHASIPDCQKLRGGEAVRRIDREERAMHATRLRGPSPISSTSEDRAIRADRDRLTIEKRADRVKGLIGPA